MTERQRGAYHKLGSVKFTPLSAITGQAAPKEGLSFFPESTSELVAWLNKHCQGIATVQRLAQAETPDDFLAKKGLQFERMMRIRHIIRLLQQLPSTLRRTKENLEAAQERADDLLDLLNEYIWFPVVYPSDSHSPVLRIALAPRPRPGLSPKNHAEQLEESEVLYQILELAKLGVLNRLRNCGQCGDWYFANRNDKTWCSRKCRNKHQSSKARAKFFWNGYRRWQYRFEHGITKLSWEREKEQLAKQWKLQEKEHGNL